MHGLLLPLLLATTPSAPNPANTNDVEIIAGSFEPGQQPDGNTVVFRGPQGLVVLDTGRHPAHSRRILDYAKASGQPIVAVVNSHWHLDHVSGNPRLRAAYPQLRVYASNAMDGAMHGFLADSKKQGFQLLDNPEVPDSVKAEVRADMETIDKGKALYPDVAVTQAGERELAGRKLRFGFERAATQGDLWLYDAATKTLAAGDLVTLPVPFLDTACAQRWSQALAHLEQVPFERLVPGHGGAMDRQAFAGYRKAFDNLVQCAAGAADKASCREGWVRDAGPLLSEHDRKYVGGMLDYYIGLLRNAEKRAQLCAG